MLSQWLIGVAGLVGIAAWARASWAARMLMLTAPDGEEMATLTRLGLWQLRQIEAVNGPSAAPHLRAFRHAAIVLGIAVICGMVIGAFFWDPSLTPPDPRA